MNTRSRRRAFFGLSGQEDLGRELGFHPWGGGGGRQSYKWPKFLRNVRGRGPLVILKCAQLPAGLVLRARMGSGGCSVLGGGDHGLPPKSENPPHPTQLFVFSPCKESLEVSWFLNDEVVFGLAQSWTACLGSTAGAPPRWTKKNARISPLSCCSTKAIFIRMLPVFRLVGGVGIGYCRYFLSRLPLEIGSMASNLKLKSTCGLKAFERSVWEASFDEPNFPPTALEKLISSANPAPESHLTRRRRPPWPVDSRPRGSLNLPC